MQHTYSTERIDTCSVHLSSLSDPIQPGQLFCAHCALPLNPASIAAFAPSRPVGGCKPPCGPYPPPSARVKIQTFPATKREVKVKEYKDAKEYERDAQRMVSDGWQSKTNHSADAC